MKNWAGLKQDLNVSHFTDGSLVFTFQFSIRTNIQVNFHISKEYSVLLHISIIHYYFNPIF